jgi:hypothetical protein
VPTYFMLMTIVCLSGIKSTADPKQKRNPSRF